MQNFLLIFYMLNPLTVVQTLLRNDFKSVNLPFMNDQVDRSVLAIANFNTWVRISKLLLGEFLCLFNT